MGRFRLKKEIAFIELSYAAHHSGCSIYSVWQADCVLKGTLLAGGVAVDVKPDLFALSVMSGHLEVSRTSVNNITFLPGAQNPPCHFLVTFKTTGWYFIHSFHFFFLTLFVTFLFFGLFNQRQSSFRDQCQKIYFLMLFQDSHHVFSEYLKIICQQEISVSLPGNKRGRLCFQDSS